MCKIILLLLLILCVAPVFGQSIKTLDDEVVDALAREYPEWKTKDEGSAFLLDARITPDGVLNPRMYGTWLDGQRRLSISITINSRPEEEFSWFFTRQVMPPSRPLTGIGEKAYLVETGQTTEIAFTKENLFIRIDNYFPRQSGKKIRSIYVETAPKEEVERALRIARGLDKLIVGKRGMTPCYNDFYNPVFPQPKTDSEKLLAAALNGDTASVKKFVTSGVSTEVTDKEGNSPLHLAIRTSCLETVRALIDARANVNARNGKQETPLMVAVNQRQLETARLLISSGADVNAKDKYGNNAAYHVLVSNRYSLFAKIYKRDDTIVLLKMLKDAGLDLNYHDTIGGNTLFTANFGNGERIELWNMLLELGVDINGVDNQGESALIQIVRRGLIDETAVKMVKFLISRGITANLKDSRGLTALDYLRQDRERRAKDPIAVRSVNEAIRLLEEAATTPPK